MTETDLELITRYGATRRDLMGEIMYQTANGQGYSCDAKMLLDLMALARQAERESWNCDVIKYGESAGFKYNHSHPYPLCQGCVTEGREEAEKAFTTPIRKYIEAIATQCERIKVLEADKEIQATELRGKINEISVLSAKIRKLEAALDKIANASTISKDNNQDYWEAKKIAKEAVEGRL